MVALMLSQKEEVTPFPQTGKNDLKNLFKRRKNNWQSFRWGKIKQDS
jgi:hypothetical protein